MHPVNRGSQVGLANCHTPNNFGLGVVSHILPEILLVQYYNISLLSTHMVTSSEGIHYVVQLLLYGRMCSKLP